MAKNGLGLTLKKYVKSAMRGFKAPLNCLIILDFPIPYNGTIDTDPLFT